MAKGPQRVVVMDVSLEKVEAMWDHLDNIRQYGFGYAVSIGSYGEKWYTCEANLIRWSDKKTYTAKVVSGSRFNVIIEAIDGVIKQWRKENENPE